MSFRAQFRLIPQRINSELRRGIYSILFFLLRPAVALCEGGLLNSSANKKALVFAPVSLKHVPPHPIPN